MPTARRRTLGDFCYQPGEVPAAAALPQVTPALVLRAFRRIPLPESQVVIQPPNGRTLVNFDTIFSTQAEPFTRTIRLLGHRVELDIKPTTFHWWHGDASTAVTDWPGMAYARGTPLDAFITHRYLDAVVTVHPRVDTTWSATYRVDGGAWRDVGDTVTITGQPAALAVLEAAPKLVG